MKCIVYFEVIFSPCVLNSLGLNCCITLVKSILKGKGLILAQGFRCFSLQ